MSASMKIDISMIKRLQERIGSPAVATQIREIPKKKAIAALVGQAIADNFDKEGPGWAPLKAKTIRYSISKKGRKSIADMTDKELLAYEAKSRKKGSEQAPHRMILQKTGLLKKVSTTPGASGSSSGKKPVTGTNIYKVEGTNLIWGVDLVYAGVHQHGSSEKNIPARPYLVIRPDWYKKIYMYMATEITKIVRAAIKAGG